MKLPLWLFQSAGRVLDWLPARDPAAPPLALSWQWEGPLPSERDPAAIRAQTWTSPPPSWPPRLPPGGGVLLFSRLRFKPEDREVLRGLFGAEPPCSGWGAYLFKEGSSGHWIILAEGYILRVEDPSRRGWDWSPIFGPGS